MKKVIGTKMYNTETATEVARYDNNLSRGDFRALEESLYITKKGNWFLAGEGGAMTKYWTPCGNAATGGKGIIPLTKKEALVWLEEHEETDVIEEYFKESIEEA